VCIAYPTDSFPCFYPSGHRRKDGDEIPIYKVSFKVRGAYLAQILKVLHSVRVPSEYGELDILDVRCSSEILPKTTRTSRKQHGALCCPSSLDRRSILEINSTIVDDSDFSFDHVVLIVCASGIAAVGLLSDSDAFLLASFFISPMLTMILAFTWGMTIKDYALALRGLLNIVFGGLLCIATGAMFGLLVLAFESEQNTQDLLCANLADGGKHGPSALYAAISINSHAIVSRGPPVYNVWDAGVVAAISGVAVALGMSSGISRALAGVALSTSLLPPLVNCGIMGVMGFAFPDVRTSTGYTLHQTGEFSLFLYVINLSLVFFCAYITFKAKHIGCKTIHKVGSGGQNSVIGGNSVDPEFWPLTLNPSPHSKFMRHQGVDNNLTDLEMEDPVQTLEQQLMGPYGERERSSSSNFGDGLVGTGKEKLFMPVSCESGASSDYTICPIQRIKNTCACLCAQDVYQEFKEREAIRAESDDLSEEFGAKIQKKDHIRDSKRSQKTSNKSSHNKESDSLVGSYHSDSPNGSRNGDSQGDE
jgi:uncharacterized membrane protein